MAQATDGPLRGPPDTEPNSEPTLEASQAYTTRQRFIITDLVFELLGDAETFSILDGGARGGPSDPRWRGIGDKRLILYGFEVDEQECAKLNDDAVNRGLPHQYYATALWSSPGQITVYGNKADGGGSVYPQNVELTNRWKFQNSEQKFLARDIFYPVGESVFPATTIDRWADEHHIPAIDFLKLNVQGAELEILRGAPQMLQSTLGLQVEVSFVESYIQRPMFSDVDAFVRERGFEFFDLIGLHYIGRSESPITSLHTPGLYPYHGQLIEGHAVYFRDPIRGGLIPPSFSRLLKLASIAEIYGQVEYAFEVLDWCARRFQERECRSKAVATKRLRDCAAQHYQRYLGARI